MSFGEEATFLKVIENYVGDSAYLTLYLICIIYIAFRFKKEDRGIFLYYPLVLVVMILNPFTFDLITSRLQDDTSTYYRFLWTFPVLLTIAFSAINIISKAQPRIKKFILVGIITITIAFSGTSIFANGTWKLAENIYKVPTSVIDICQYIKGSSDEDMPVVIFPSEISLLIRQYDASIRVKHLIPMAIEGTALSEKEKEALYFLANFINTNDAVNTNNLKEALNIIHANYFVIPNNTSNLEALFELRYELLKDIQGYYIFAV